MQGLRLQKVLIVAQFAVSVLILTSTVIIYKQLGYIQYKDLGFDREHVVYFYSIHLRDQYENFRNKLESKTSIVSVSAGVPLGMGGRHTMERKGLYYEDELLLSIMEVDNNFLETMGLHLKEGREFSKDLKSDMEMSVIINESAAKWLGLGDSAVGQTVTIMSRGGRVQREVIGVIRDFHNTSLRSPVQPVAMIINPESFGIYIVRLAPGNIQQGIADIQEVWSLILPNYPLDISFLNSSIAGQYHSDQRHGRLMLIFSGIAIFLACIGLFGLTMLMTQNRTKEIGIRKVLGATVSGIVALLSKDFLKLVLIGFIIAIPIGWYAMSRWLEEFVYRIEMGPGAFILAGALAVAVAFATVSFHSVKAALMNPAESLRNE